ncbi:hypothetical protein TTHERM_000609439 (macronuclear) [Tetrahymena thermophila SB210]|uniref:Uncharacterized protein n=1 Tax=Tetrahymena thermophila (strain SB210) TaxID=312017 RepID=W7XDZ2_TETTS|nr:hypothetical protein TTHERM_000609439 [Tetrahymena thermophila SB210]EWS75827.1 hypothetical protein TTHERM_000609439 [Tetrahymena thermophila SB210]|eukprot:XP_012651641.1 hypothetical protein TTHERM_000609439 [Tetrahymena thermophila SB210]
MEGRTKLQSQMLYQKIQELEVLIQQIGVRKDVARIQAKAHKDILQTLEHYIKKISSTLRDILSKINTENIGQEFQVYQELEKTIHPQRKTQQKLSQIINNISNQQINEQGRSSRTDEKRKELL